MKLKITSYESGHIALSESGKKNEKPTRIKIPVNRAHPDVGAEVDVVEVEGQNFVRLK